MQALLSLSHGIDWISKKFGQVCDYLVLFCALISAGNATVRYVFSMSSNGWLEIQWYMFGAIVLLGASHTLRMNEHVRVDLFYGAVGDRARLWIDVLGLIFFLLPISIFFLWLSWPFFYSSYTSCFSGSSAPADWLSKIPWYFETMFAGNGCEQSSNAGGLLRWPVKSLLVLGFALLTLQGVAELIKRVAALAGIEKIDTTYEKPLQ
jgi:TRAP-type mannitol/chloroaromatic compound transport system permease small subunit